MSAASGSINIVLSSYANCDVFPRNTRTRFTNRLPAVLSNRSQQQFHVRLCLLAFSNDPGGENTSSYLEVHLREIESQRSGTGSTESIGGFTFPLPERLSENYGVYNFTRSPYLPIKFQQLTSLEVIIVDREGNEPAPYEKGPPTLVWIEMTDKSVEEQFTIQCFSRQPYLFPANQLGAFTASIPSELELNGWEVALQQVIYPPRMEDVASEARVTINEETYSFNLRNFAEPDDFVEAVSQAVARGAYGRALQFGKRGGYIYFRRRATGDVAEDGRIIDITPSKTFCMACGQTTVPRRTTRINVGHMFTFRGKVGIRQALPNPIAMLTCDLVKTNVLAGSKALVLQAVPLKIGMETHSPRLYEPPNLIYQPVQSKPFNLVRFSFLEPDGREKELVADNEEEGIIISLVFRKRKPAQ